MLDDIPNVGPARRAALLRHYENIAQIKNAWVYELKNIPGMKIAAAKSIYVFFNQGGKS